jgi:hypothetical protein
MDDFSKTFDHDIRHFNPAIPYWRENLQGDEPTPVRFLVEAIKDDTASEKEGRPMFRDVECIQIFNSKDNVIDRPVRDTDKQRWPNAYARWKASGQSEPGSTGTPLEHWPQMTRAQVEEFKYFKVYTVEQLAQLADSTAQKIMGAVKLKQLANLAVEAAKGEAPFARMQAELDKRDGQIAELTNEVARLSKMIAEKLQV